MIGIAILYIILGILVKNGKMHQLIAGFNTMSAREQKKYDMEGIASVMRNGLFLMALIIILGYPVAYWLGNQNMEFIALAIATIIGVPYILIASNSKKYRKE